MEKYSELSPEKQASFLGRVNQRWGQLHALEKDWGEKAYKYLFLTNSGGVVATLTFLGAKPDNLDFTAAKLALMLFVVGVVITGIATAHRLHRTSWLFKSYRQDSQDYFQGKLTWEQLYKLDEDRATQPNAWSYLLPYSCLATFIAGCAAGGFALFGGIPNTTSSLFTALTTGNTDMTIVQLLAACIGILGSVFFSIGVMAQNARSIAALCIVYAGANPNIAKSYAAQKSDYLIGSCLIGLAFILQFVSLIAPKVGVLPITWTPYAPWIALLASGATYLVLKRLAANRAAQYGKQIQSEISNIYKEHEAKRSAAQAASTNKSASEHQ
jgi:hypothetical protein